MKFKKQGIAEAGIGLQGVTPCYLSLAVALYIFGGFADLDRSLKATKAHRVVNFLPK